MIIQHKATAPKCSNQPRQRDRPLIPVDCLSISLPSLPKQRGHGWRLRKLEHLMSSGSVDLGLDFTRSSLLANIPRPPHPPRLLHDIYSPDFGSQIRRTHAHTQTHTHTHREARLARSHNQHQEGETMMVVLDGRLSVRFLPLLGKWCTCIVYRAVCAWRFHPCRPILVSTSQQ